MLPKNFPHRKKQRHQEALARKAEYDKLTPEQVLAKLDATFGVGKGAAKQRARLKKATTLWVALPAEAVVEVLSPEAEKKVAKPRAKRSATKRS